MPLAYARGSVKCYSISAKVSVFKTISTTDTHGIFLPLLPATPSSRIQHLNFGMLNRNGCLLMNFPSPATLMVTLLSPKFIIFYVFIASTLYIHLRGSVRYNFTRQLTDHSTFLAPMNAFVYLFSAVPRDPYLDPRQFEDLNVLRDNWEMLREEAVALYEQGYVKASDKHDDVGFNSFFRTGWKRFYLKWYDKTLPSAEQYCPKTVALLNQLPSIDAAIFALLPKDGRLVRHRDPFAGSLRYHLGLMTPNSEKCYINVDGQVYSWKDGKDTLFDETYIHYAENQSEADRLIMFCDVVRPMRFRFATKINHWFGKYFMAASATRNFDDDKIGFINRIFKYLYAIRLVGKRLKAFNKPLYYTVKYIVFGGLLYLIFF
jgi:beta-hydroxylase